MQNKETMMDYRKVYSKLIRLGKTMTPEGRVARSKARLVKERHIGTKDLRRYAPMLDIVLWDMNFYNYHYVPTGITTRTLKNELTKN